MAGRCRCVAAAERVVEGECEAPKHARSPRLRCENGRGGERLAGANERAAEGVVGEHDVRHADAVGDVARLEMLRRVRSDGKEVAEVGRRPDEAAVGDGNDLAAGEQDAAVGIEAAEARGGGDEAFAPTSDRASRRARRARRPSRHSRATIATAAA